MGPSGTSILKIGDRIGGDSQTILVSEENLEAPNWSPDGQWLVYNSQGRLYRLRANGTGIPERIDTGVAQDLNNDHVISPDGTRLYLSNNDGHLYSVPWEGGFARRVSNDHEPEREFHHYLHGISPDGATLVYVGLEKNATGRWHWDLWSIPSGGGPDRRLTSMSCPCDGPEISPDGQWLYYNSEEAATLPGHSQLFRRPWPVGPVEQLTFDERVNWFPHSSPDGAWIAYLSYPPGTEGHPADRSVEIRLLPRSGGTSHTLAAFRGGQGTLNVNSWAPDSRQLAWVEYP